MLAGHLEETAPKGVTELTVQMGLSPVLVTGVNSVPGGIFRSLCLYSEGFPPFLPSLLVPRRKLTGEADRAAVKTVTSVSFVLQVGETQVQGVTGVTPSSATAPVRGPAVTPTSHCPGPAPRSTDRTVAFRDSVGGKVPSVWPSVASGTRSGLFVILPGKVMATWPCRHSLDPGCSSHLLECGLRCGKGLRRVFGATFGK